MRCAIIIIIEEIITLIFVMKQDRIPRKSVRNSEKMRINERKCESERERERERLKGNLC